MPIRVACPGCNRTGNAPDASAGHSVTCKCGASILVPVPGTNLVSQSDGFDAFSTQSQASLVDLQGDLGPSAQRARARAAKAAAERKPRGVWLANIAVGVAGIAVLIVAAGLGSPLLLASTFLYPAILLGSIACVLGFVGLFLSDRVFLAAMAMIGGGAVAAFALETAKAVEARRDEIRRDIFRR